MSTAHQWRITRCVALGIFLFSLILGGSVWADDPIVYFTDLISGPKSGNSDSSSGRIPGQDGAIVTVWGRNLGRTLDSTRVYCNGAPAASYYFLGAATQPANLAVFHQMQMLVFQISHSATDGAGEIQVEVVGRRSNPLPFTVRNGGIFYVTTNGHDDTGTGEPYIAAESGALPTGDFRNSWFGRGVPPAWDTGAIAEDPQLTDPDHGNFSLRKGSPCIDAGRDVTAIVPRDLLGLIRPQVSAPDLGALEFSDVITLRLQVILAANRLSLTWNGGNGIRLQRFPTLSGGAWIDVENTEGQSVIQLPAGQASEFFRLI